MTGADIITSFELQVDDMTELSSTEELNLLNAVYQEIMGSRAWEITKKQGTGTQSTSVPYIALPTDFHSLALNHSYTDRGAYGERPVVFVGSGYDPYQVVSWSDRRQYRTKSNVCYIDIVNSRLYFTVQPTSALAIEFDYHSVPADLATNTSPVFPSRFHKMLAFAMAVDDSILQMSDKAKSYAPENKARLEKYLEDMEYWDASLQQF